MKKWKFSFKTFIFKLDLIKFSVFICFLQIHYQTHGQFLIGIKSGINLNTVTVDTRNIEHTQSEFLPGFQVGAAAEIGLNSYLSIKTEFLYSQKGYRIRKFLNADLLTKNNTIYSDYWSLTTNYFEMPVLANLYYEGKRFKVFANAGPYVGYWLSAQKDAAIYMNDLGDVSQTPTQKKTSQNYDFDNVYGNNKKIDNRIDFGAAGGLGVGMKIKNGWLSLEGRYNLGLMDMNTFENEKPITYQPQYHRNIAITLSYVIIIIPRKKLEPNPLDQEVDEEKDEN